MKPFLLFLLLTPTLWAQNSQRHIEDIQVASPFIVVHLNDGYYQFTWFNTSTVQAQYINNQDSLVTASHAVVAHPENLQLDLINHGDSYRIKANNQGIEVRLQKKPFAVSYYHNDQLITQETEGFTPTETGFNLDFALQTNEQLFGGGSRVLGPNHRNQTLPLYNKAHYSYGTHSAQMNFCLPIVVSDHRYLLHLDNASTGKIDIGQSQKDRLQFQLDGGAKRYQVVLASTYKELTENYTALTGRQPLPPRWALGNFASRFGYRSQRETEQVVADFAKAEIPLDAVILDLYWFGKTIKGTMGNLAVDRDSFPRFEEMTRQFKNKNIQTVVITEPYITTTSSKWDEAVQKNLLATNAKGEAYVEDLFFGPAGLLDIYKPDTAAWFWDIYESILDLGVTGLWGDLGEPEKHSKDVYHHIGQAKDAHNIYGHQWAKLIYEGYKHNRAERPFILMRAGYSGSQRYGMIPWSGDVVRHWDGLQPQPLISLQMGLQGLAYMHSDLGGFAGTYRDAELYLRWLQYGVFNPIYRPHAFEEVPAEPVYWDKKTMENAKKAIELRYRLLPYNYTAAYQNTAYGYPLMRPSNWTTDMALPDGKAYFWGDHFFVAPVTTKGQTELHVSLPEGTWLDFYTEKAYRDETTIQLTPEYIPTFVRAGALIPTAEGLKTTQDYQLSNVHWHFYYHPEMTQQTGEFFYDNGIDASTLENDKYHHTQWTTTANGQSVQIALDGKQLENTTTEQPIQTWHLHGLPKKCSFKLNGKTLHATRAKSGIWQVSIPYSNQLNLEITW